MTDMEQALVDINNASIEELTSLSGIGLSLAMKIINKRPFKELQGLVDISGINEVKLASLKPYITIGETRTKASPPEETLDQMELAGKEPISKLGDTEAFVFLEDRNERQDALLIIFGGFILGLIILLIRRSDN
mgnify:CR=1 FL=1